METASSKGNFRSVHSLVGILGNLASSIGNRASCSVCTHSRGASRILVLGLFWDPHQEKLAGEQARYPWLEALSICYLVCLRGFVL